MSDLQATTYMNDCAAIILIIKVLQVEKGTVR